MDRSTVIVEDYTSRPAGAAVLTLQRGVSTWASWTFQPSDAGTEITVGSAPGCDWQVAAPGVPPIELLFTGEELFVWVEQEREEVRCNDATLPLGFTLLRHGDRLDLGPARIVVSLGADLVPASSASSSAESRRSRGPGDLADASARGKVSLHSAELRVRRGSSRLPGWTFTGDDVGRSVTVGASDACDLQVIAAGVEGNELIVLCAGDTLLVKSARTEGAKLNGRYLSEEWQFLRDGDRLDLGTACIDVHIPAIDLAVSGERKVEELTPPKTPPVPPQARRSRSSAAATRQLVQSTMTMRLPAPPVARPARATVPQAVLCTPRTLLEVPLPRAAAASWRAPVGSQVESRSEGELLGCLFETPSNAAHPRRWRMYAASLVLIAAAYLGWLAMLERW